MSKIARFDIRDEGQTARLAALLAGRAEICDIFTLHGTLGTGKSAFARAFIRALMGADEDVPSPTFTLVQYYDAPDFHIYHFDLYRLEAPEEAFELGIDDAFEAGVSLIEWPDRLEGCLPEDRLNIHIAIGTQEGERVIELDGGGAWAERLEGMSLD